MRKILLYVTCCAFALHGCTSLGDSIFLVSKLPNKEKSKAITEAGIAEYRLIIVQQNNTDKLTDVEEYFKVALRYDPTNKIAERYLAVLDDYRESALRENIKRATTLLKKGTLSENESYDVAVSVQRAVKLDASDAEASKLLTDTSAMRKNLVTSYIKQADESLKKVDPKTTEADREVYYLDAFTSVNRAVDVEPKDYTANRYRQDLLADISSIVKARIDKLEVMYTGGDYEHARERIATLRELDRKLDGAFRTQLDDAEYRLYYSWAMKLRDGKDYPAAITKVDAAIGVRRTDEATALKTDLSTQIAKIEQGADFSTAITNIDRMIARGNYAGAQRVIAAITKKTTEADRRKALAIRREQILDAIEGIYAKGVQAYRDEKFKEAIAHLETVVVIDADYQQAADYLEKARAKQRLLDQF